MTAPFERLDAVLGDRYRLGDVLGRGGMATVYRGTDLRHGRSVAIKVLHRELAGATTPERFRREIRVLAALRHPHVLPLLDSVEAPGCLAYVMPLAQGSLRDRLTSEGPQRLAAALACAIEAADALEVAPEARGLQFIGGLGLRAWTLAWRGDHAEALDAAERAEAALATSDHLLAPVYTSLVGCVRGDALLGMDDPASAVRAFGQVLTAIRAPRVPVSLGWNAVRARLGRARAFIRLGMRTEGRAEYAEATSELERRSMPAFEWMPTGHLGFVAAELARAAETMDHRDEAGRWMRVAVAHGLSRPA